jgi:hypothetical protein
MIVTKKARVKGSGKREADGRKDFFWGRALEKAKVCP